MALSAKEFRDIERRKMRLQADIAARRNSLMTMGNASIVPRPDDLPSKFDKAVADANNAAALKYLENSGNEFGPQSLNTLAAKGQIMDPFNSLNLYPQVTSSPFTKALNTRAANLTADDQYRVGLSSGPFTPSKNRTSGRGFSQGAMDSLYDKSPSRLYDPSLLAAVDGGVGQDTGVDRRTHPAPTWRPPMRYPGVNPERAQNSSPSQASMPNQTGNYGPGLTPAAAEELYGPGGMYGTQPLARGLYQGKTSSTSGGRSAPQSASQGLADSIRQIKKRAGIIRGTAALMGGDTRAADRYEAKAMASLGVYAGQYALSNLDDADFQSKRKLFQALLKNGMPIDQIIDVIKSGVAETAGKKKFVNWTDGTKTISLREGQQAPPGYWVGKLEGGSKGNSMRFIDTEGIGHLGYVQHDENGVPRNFLMDGSPVPLDWDMVSPIASRNKTEITNNLAKQGEKMGEARQIAMAQMSQKWSNDAAAYFFDSSGRFKADRLDIFLTSLDVPGEGRLAWTQMKNALAAALRLESGAAIGVEEAANYKERFFPKMTDTEKTIIWKLRAFNDYVRALETINNPQWVYENLPHPAWNPKKVRTQKERDALPHGSYFITPNGNLGRYVPNQTEAEVLLP